MTYIERGHPSFKWLNDVRPVVFFGRTQIEQKDLDLAQTVIAFGFDQPGWYLE